MTVAGEVIESTGHHPWWVVRGDSLSVRPQPDHVPLNPEGYNGSGRWIDAIDLQIGDVLLLRSGEQAAITQLVVRYAQVQVYNFQVEELHCYAVGSVQVLVHNNSFSHAWIQHNLFNELNGLTGAANKSKFVAALEKGVVGPTGESGIKVLRAAVGVFTHELKIGGSSARLLGRVVDGVLVFDKYVPGGLH